MNYIIFSCLSLALLIGAHAAGIKNRIVKGENADIINYPHQISLRMSDKHICGGSIISERHILTAAHCVDGVTAKYPRLLKYLSVNTGSSLSSGKSGKSYGVEKLAIHEDWSGEKEDSYKNDIAVVTLTENIEFDEKTKKINLPTQNVGPDEYAVVTGWGSNKFGSEISTVVLQKAYMLTITSQDCQKQIPLKLSAGKVCAYKEKGVGICNGDSGGPLVVDHELVGVVSWSVACGLGFPDVYTDVYYYKDWIHKQMEN